MKKNLILLGIIVLANLAAWADTVTIGTNAYNSSVLTGANFYAATNGIFTYYGFPTTNYPGAGTTVSTIGISSTNELGKFPPVQVAFAFTGTNCELLLSSYDYLNKTWGGMCYFTISDGQTTTVYTNVPNNGPGAAPRYVEITFSSNITHQVFLCVKGGFAGVNVPSGNTVSSCTLNKPNLLIMLGDSYTEGYNPTVLVYGYPSYWFDGWVWQLSRMVPNTVCIPSGLGGTGYYTTNVSTGGLPFWTRVTNDVCRVYANALNSGKYNQIFVAVSGSINDDGAPTNAVFQNATNVMWTIKNACRQAHVFMVGNWLGCGGESSPGANDYALEWAMTNAAAQVGLPMFDPIPANLKNAGNYFSVFYPPGSYTDQVHPSAAGYAIYAAWVNTNLAYRFGTNWDSSSKIGGGTVFYSLAVNNGSGSGSYTNGQVVSITASNVAGSYFSNWSGANIANPNAATTTVIMPAANASVTANFAAISTGTSLDVSSYGAVADVVSLAVHTVSNSVVVSVVGTNSFTSADVGKVIEVFRAGPWVSYQGGVVVTQQDIICTITNVVQGTNLYLTIPAGWTTNAYCVIGKNNAPAFQAAINAASDLVATGAATNVTINIPNGTFLLVSSNVLNPNYVMASITDTHPALTISSGGITLLGGTNTILMGCGAGMNHLVSSNNMYPPGEAPYLPMRDTMFFCQGPVASSQYPLVFQNLTFDGGLTNGVQNYSYWEIHQGDGSGWDTTHHAVADSGGVNNVNGTLVQWQMHQLKVFTNCIFQHWRGEMLICWTADITNAFNDIANCTFHDGNATADNMYYGQHIHGCTFNSLVKVMEYYQGNASLPTVFEDNLWTNIINDGASYYALTIVGATTNAVPPAFVISNNVMHDETGMNAIQFSPAANVSVVANSFIGSGGGVVFTSAGVQPSDGSAIPVMTNFFIANNTFAGSGNPLSMDGYGVSGVLISNNVGIAIVASAGYKNNVVLADNSGSALVGGPTFEQHGIQQGSYMIDQANNNFGSYFEGNGQYAATNLVSYGNGRFHQFTASGSKYFLDDSVPKLIPAGATLELSASTLTGQNVTNVYMSEVSPGSPITITNGAAPVVFYWNGTAWSTSVTNSLLHSLAPPSGLQVQGN